MKRERWVHTIAVALVALAARAVVVTWAHARFPPVADGTFYAGFAARLARGLGYTVAWPDGVVTYAAHYPVGYPAMLAVAYRIFGARAAVAMSLNALVGVIGSASAHRLAIREMTPKLALVAGLAVALHPALVVYTPVIMTEGVAVSLVVTALAALPVGAPVSKYVYFAHVAASGLIFGLATLVRPQVVALIAPLAFIFMRRRDVARRLLGAGIVLGVALLTVAPWTARNCARMHRCALVSVNGGWNLLIGAQTEDGAWAALDVPDGCKTVWDEAQKDLCFERAARVQIAAHPFAWIRKAPRKLEATFDTIAAGPWYLHQSNPSAFDDRTQLAVGAVETIASRFLLAAAFVASAPIFVFYTRKRRWPKALPRFLLAALGIAIAFARHAWMGYALLAVACLVRGRGERASALRTSAGIVLGATLLTHAAFFGAGRYGLLVVPSVTLAAFACVRPKALSASLGLPPSGGDAPWMMSASGR